MRRSNLVRCNIVGESRSAVNPLWYRELIAAAHQMATSRRFTMSAIEYPRRNSIAVRAQGADRAAPTYSISDLAQEFALTTRAIRFYEDEGLLAPVRRGQTRVYGERERTRIKLILRGKRLGLALVRNPRNSSTSTRRRGNERPQLAKFLQMLADRRAMLLQQREDIDAVLAEIGVLERDCRRRLKTVRATKPVPR